MNDQKTRLIRAFVAFLILPADLRDYNNWLFAGMKVKLIHQNEQAWLMFR